MSVLGEGSKITLYLPIPPHSGYRFSPPSFHALEGALVRVITAGHHFFEMAILRFYHLISRISVEGEITWTTHLSTCHRLHKALHPFIATPLPQSTWHPGTSGLRNADEVARGVAERAVAHSPGLSLIHI